MAASYTNSDVRVVIQGIREHWPEVGTLPELAEVEAMLPADGPELDREVSPAVSSAIAQLEIALLREPPPRPFGVCGPGAIWGWPFGVCERVFPRLWPANA